MFEQNNLSINKASNTNTLSFFSRLPRYHKIPMENGGAPEMIGFDIEVYSVIGTHYNTRTT